MLRPLAPHDFRRGARCAGATRSGCCRGSRAARRRSSTRPINRDAFVARCAARDRDAAAGTAYGFGVFVDDDLAGEVNLNNVLRGAMQSATIGYWIDRARAGQSLIAEGVVVLMPSSRSSSWSCTGSRSASCRATATAAG